MANIPLKFLIAAIPLPLGLMTLPLVDAAGNHSAQPAAAVAGWMLLLLLGQGITAIVAGSLCRNFRLSIVTAAVSAMAAAIPAALACVMRLMTVTVLLHGIVVFVAWAIFCAGLASVLRYWSVASAVALGEMITTIMFFSPVALTPFFLMMQRTGIHGPWLTAIALNMSPAMWMLGAVATGGLHYNWFTWFHAPQMYQHIALGQNTMMPPLWPWWLSCAGAAGIGVIAALWPRRRNSGT